MRCRFGHPPDVLGFWAYRKWIKVQVNVQFCEQKGSSYSKVKSMPFTSAIPTPVLSQCWTLEYHPKGVWGAISSKLYRGFCWGKFLKFNKSDMFLWSNGQILPLGEENRAGLACFNFCLLLCQHLYFDVTQWHLDFFLRKLNLITEINVSNML